MDNITCDCYTKFIDVALSMERFYNTKEKILKKEFSILGINEDEASQRLKKAADSFKDSLNAAYDCGFPRKAVTSRLRGADLNNLIDEVARDNYNDMLPLDFIEDAIWDGLFSVTPCYKPSK